LRSAVDDGRMLNRPHSSSMSSTAGLALALVLVGPVAVRAEEPEISLGVGTQKIVSVPGLQRIAVGNPEIIDVKVIGANQLLIVGTKEGLTTLITWAGSGEPRTIRVRTARSDGCTLGIHELDRLLGKREGITIRMIGDRIYLDGTAYTSEDLLRVHQITTLYPNVRSLVKASATVAKVTEEQISHELEKRGFKNIRVSVIGSTIFLEGTVDSEADLKKAELVTEAMIPS
jgi:pilus assembly protein CpaC